MTLLHDVGPIVVDAGMEDARPAVNELTTRSLAHSAMTASEQLAEQQRREDTAVRGDLEAMRAFLGDHMPENTDFYLCGDPEEAGVSRDALIDLEGRGYQDSGYGERAEGKRLFDEAYRGYEQHSGLRYVILGEKQQTEDGEKVKPLAFFNYFKVGEHHGPEWAEAAAEVEMRHGLEQTPDIYIFSKLVRDPDQRRTIGDLHRLALASTLVALAKASSAGVYVETQAQPATRAMVRRAGPQYVPGLEIALDQELDVDDEGGKPSKMLIYVPSPPQQPVEAERLQDEQR